jgi:hypothetical protein
MVLHIVVFSKLVRLLLSCFGLWYHAERSMISPPHHSTDYQLIDMYYSPATCVPM